MSDPITDANAGLLSAAAYTAVGTLATTQLSNWVDITGSVTTKNGDRFIF